MKNPFKKEEEPEEVEEETSVKKTDKAPKVVTYKSHGDYDPA